ncbi:helix-turn-helix domain-containing protein [Flavobacterium sp. LAR06]|uniref:helix-turn-helix domain-containing protein n=1 Tax=Flavobacterium sp. LAR06 TaxID=3064897 RepID=UPI0035C129E8
MKYEKLTSNEKQFYIAKIESIVHSKKLFLQRDFSLPKLAEEISIPLHTISYIVNSELNLHFSDYINLKRIEYFLEIISDPLWHDSTIQEIAEASGFRSRTTFYRSFVRHIGVSPSEYLKNHAAR